MKRRKSTPAYLYFLADFFNLMVEMLIYFVSLAGPGYLLWYFSPLHPLTSIALLIVCFLLVAVIFLSVLVAIKAFLIGEVPTGRFLLDSSSSYRWMAADRLNKIMLRSPFRGLVTENAFFRYLYYRGIGMRFDPTLLLGSRAVIGEPWAMNIGKNVLIGADAGISGHKVQGNVVTLEEVTIGDDVLIGSRALIMPGVKIGDRAVVGANSVVIRGSVIPEGETWIGNPARRMDFVTRGR